MATCMLCGKQAGLGKGHVVPRWALRLTSDFNDFFMVHDKGPGEDAPITTSKVDRSKIGITDKMFCTESQGIDGCEQIIGKGEDELKKVFVDGDLSSISYARGEFPYKVIVPKNFNLISRGIAGILLKFYLSEKHQPASLFTYNQESVDLLIRATKDDSFSSRIVKFAVIKSYSNLIENTFRIQSAGYISLYPVSGGKIFLLSFGGLTLIVALDVDSPVVGDKILVFAEHIREIRANGGRMEFIPRAISIYNRKYSFVYSERQINPLEQEFMQRIADMQFRYNLSDSDVSYIIEKITFEPKYMPDMHLLLVEASKLSNPRADSHEIWADMDLFKAFIDPSIHRVLGPEWLSENQQYEDCFCGNLQSKSQLRRKTKECCGHFWELAK